MIQIDQLHYGYKRGQEALSSLSLEMGSGNICGLLGKNGAGKSTLLKALSGLIFPQQGAVNVLAYQPSQRDPNFLSEVYLVTEEFTLPGFSIGQYQKLHSPFYPRFSHEAFDAYLEEFELKKDQVLTNLSYGQKKKFLLSFGLATDCQLLLLDEPTNGLDIPSKRQFRKVLANAIHEDRNFIVSTHQVRDMENLIDPLIILDEGKIVFHESIESISNKVSFQRVNELPEEGLIYHESYLGGYTVLVENKEEEATHLNLELLFNAVADHQCNILEIFNHQPHE